MGIGSQDLDLLIHLKENGYLLTPASVIEIGAQQISNSFFSANQQIEKIKALFGVDSPRFFKPVESFTINGALEHLSESAILSRDFWQWLGFTYASIDINGSPDSLLLDLNYDELPAKHFAKYNLVTNFGTTEHVSNQLNAFKVIHDLTVQSGIMLHHLPSQGMLNHGLINYNPKFFWMLARSNGYKWLYADYVTVDAYYSLPQNIIDNVIPFNPDITVRSSQHKVADSYIIVALQKVYHTPYVPPLDIGIEIKSDDKMLMERYWSVFNQDAFAQYQKAYLQQQNRGAKVLFKKIANKFMKKK